MDGDWARGLRGLSIERASSPPIRQQVRVCSSMFVDAATTAIAPRSSPEGMFVDRVREWDRIPAGELGAGSAEMSQLLLFALQTLPSLGVRSSASSTNMAY